MAAKNFLTLMIFLSLQACGDAGVSDLRVFVDSAHKNKRPEIEPLPEIPPFKAFEYESQDGADPFSTSNIGSGDTASSNSVARPNADRPRQPLERFPLDALAMVGTIEQHDKSYIVVRTNEGTLSVAGIGEYMGQNDGKIKGIFPEEQRVELVETVLDASGKWVTRDIEIAINE